MNFKVAASDLDGTLYRNEKISAADMTAISEWRTAGNKFGIVTGRPFIMLKPVLKELALAVDFAICGNGAIIYDGNEQIIFESELPKKILVDIMNEPSAANSFHFAFESADKFFCIVAKETSWTVREVKRWNFPIEFIDASQITSLPKINQLALGFDTPDEAQSVADVLNKKFGDKIFAQKNSNSLDIVAAGLNKAQGVENLLRLMNWHADIFVIGDESNDLPMIKKFGGYTVATAKDFVKREAKAVFDSVGAMLNANS